MGDFTYNGIYILRPRSQIQPTNVCEFLRTRAHHILFSSLQSVTLPSLTLVNSIYLFQLPDIMYKPKPDVKSSALHSDSSNNLIHPFTLRSSP